MITASIVLYNTDISRLKLVISSYNPGKYKTLYLIDNSTLKSKDIEELSSDYIFYIFTGNNLGYGAGNNIAIREALKNGSKYHIILNPDIYFKDDVISILCDFMEKKCDVGLLMPKVIYPDGRLQYLCKLLPKPLDLFGRRFLPNKLFSKRNNLFELKFTGYDKLIEVPYLSGCFMFIRTEVFSSIGTFDENFFMYCEDIDLSRRIHKKFMTMYYPEVSIVHDHAKESYKDLKMLRHHIKSAIYYFNKWGWFFDKERKQINRKTLKKLGYRRGSQ